MTLAVSSEPIPANSTETQDLHHALASLMEELEAIDRYAQRAELCADPGLREVLVHNKVEEVEHAMMLVEWLRRTHPAFDENAHKFLLSSGAITHAELATKLLRTPQGSADGSLGLGSLRETLWTS